MELFSPTYADDKSNNLEQTIWRDVVFYINNTFIDGV